MWFFLPFRNLFRNCRRTCAILLTIGMGAGVLFSFDGFINGVLTEYRETTIHSHYGYGQINRKGYREMVYERPTDHWMGNWNRLNHFLLDQKGVTGIFPRVSFSALLSKGNTTISGEGQGVDAEKEASFFDSLNVEEGQTLYKQENGILLGKGLAKALHVKPGDSVTVTATSVKGAINKAKFTVIGIFNTGAADFDGRIFRVQLKEAQNLLNTNKIETVSLGLRNLSDWKSVASAIEQTFPQLEATSFDVLDKIYYQHSVDWLNAQFKVVQVIILSIVLLGIFNTVSAAILERKQEIGNLRANGESVFQIMQLILTEGFILGVLGTAFGLGLSYFVLTLFVDGGIRMPPGPGQTSQFLVRFRFEWYMLLLPFILNIASALVASFFAGIRVARMAIADALRSY